MKAQLLPLLLLLLLVTVELTTGETVHVKPTDYDSQCTEPCTTLNDYVSQNNGSVHLSVAFVFLEGHHVLESNLIILDSENVSLTAFSNANVTIDCGESSRLIFDRVTNLVIENIIFLSCGIPDLQPGILVQNISNGYLKNISLLGSNTTALQARISTFSLTNIFITRNRLYIDYPTAIVTIENCDVKINGEFIVTQNTGTLSFNERLTCDPSLGVKTLRKAIVMIANSTVTADAHMIVIGNVCPTGIIRYEHSKVSWTGQQKFYGNSVCVNGAIAAVNTSLTENGDMEFLQNSASYYYYPGIASTASLFVQDTTLEIAGNISIYNNYGDVTGIECFTSDIQITGELNIVDNDLVYSYSGIILRPRSSMAVIGRTTARNNLVYDSIIRTEDSILMLNDTVEFTSNLGASPVTPRYRSFIYFNGNTTFLNNSGILFGIDSTITFIGNSTFIRNNVRDLYNEGGLRVYGSVLNIGGQFLFENNNVNGIDGGVINGLDSGVEFEGRGQFKRNSARNGGVIYLQDVPRIRIAPGTELLFEGNMAREGAVFYMSGLLRDVLCYDSITNTSSLCVIQPREPYQMTFLNNTARNGGSLLHLNFLEDFDLLDISINHTSLEVITTSDREGNSDPIIAADPFRLCFCESGIPLCNITSIEHSVSKGSKFTVSVAALTFFANNIPRTVRSYFEDTSSGVTKALSGESQEISSSCTELKYRVYTTAESEQVVIAADQPCDDSPVLVHCLTFNVTLEDCPRGFSSSGDRCVCDERLKPFTQQCDADNSTLSKDTINFWIGVDLNKSDSSYLGLILHPLCAHEYCLQPPIEIDLNNPDTQCNYQRSGILCGQCSANKSLTLGDPVCTDCSNISLLLIIPMALLGVGLVVFLFLSQLTVTSGVVNGLILYANILSANDVTFDLRRVYGLRIFIAWVNLDFGIPTCFYEGMTHLTYTAWQFAFPLYLWLLVAFIIILCHYSIRASKFFGKTDPVAVLATLVLLSYNKLLRNIVDILTPAVLHYPPQSNINSIVWLYDGNVGFAQGGHAVLVIIALAFLVFLFLPFTLVLMFAQFLQKSDRISRCFNKLNLSHAIKSYQVPYKPASRYWIGLCLLLRGIIQITLISTASNDSSAHLLAVSTICIVLISIMGAAGGIYLNRWQDILEISYIFNLGVLSVLAYHIESIGGSQVAATYVSTSVAFVMFLGIFVLVLFRRLIKSGRMKMMSISEAMDKVKGKSLANKDFVIVEGDKETCIVTRQDVFLSSSSDRQMELREELLDDTY